MKYFVKEEFIDYFRQWEEDLSPTAVYGTWRIKGTGEIVNNSQDLEWFLEMYESLILEFIPENGECEEYKII